MAEQNAAAKESSPSAPAESPSKSPMLLIGLAVVNMLVVAGVGVMLFMNKQKETESTRVEQVLQGEAEEDLQAQAELAKGKKVVVPLETFIVNLSGSRGRRIAKVNLELELQSDRVASEIDSRKAQIRDIIIILLSSKTYDDVATKEGKEALRADIKDTVNAFLSSGKIVSVYFTEFIYQ